MIVCITLTHYLISLFKITSVGFSGANSCYLNWQISEQYYQEDSFIRVEMLSFRYQKLTSSNVHFIYYLYILKKRYHCQPFIQIDSMLL